MKSVTLSNKHEWHNIREQLNSYVGKYINHKYRERETDRGRNRKNEHT